MAISDVLFEAHDGISDYLVRVPERYEDVRERLERLLAEMDAIRKILDTPPVD
jgi:hypothetical protein